ncbi:MAG: NAD(P)/FAD-dependent oxidoreductase [Actinomycetota bacterium]
MLPSRSRFDAVVIGAGHNGLVAAAYLARAGLDTLLVEARDSVGGTAACETFAGATVNICNCDHLTFRTTPILDELGLREHGLRYLDVDPGQHNASWSSLDKETIWSSHHEVDLAADEIGRFSPADGAGYRRYVADARPAVELLLEAAAAPPTVRGLGALAARRRGRGVRQLLAWSRRSAADVLGDYFSSPEVAGPGAVTGPMVWGLSPTTPRTGLGALTHAMRHVATVGRPVGGSGALTEAIRASFEAAGGTLVTGATVTEIRCERNRVAGVRIVEGGLVEPGGDHQLVDCHDVDAPLVVSACNPHDTFLRWLRHPPTDAARLLERWRAVPHADGYESKLDVVLTSEPRLRGVDRSLGPTTVIAPSLADIDRGAALMATGEVLERPALFVNVPTALDDSLAPAGHHVLSVEALFTPYARPGGWERDDEPRRWLELLAEYCEPGLLESIVDWRAMTPDRYEREFHLPAGHATSFGGGPLAALRNPNPELTRYATAVPGLFLTGAATFPGAGVWGASGRNCATVALDAA